MKRRLHDDSHDSRRFLTFQPKISPPFSQITTNVALPSIGKTFNASQTALDLLAVGYSLGLAASVLWLGTLGDRYGRKLMLLIGTTLAIPASLLAAFAPSVEVLIVARLLGGLSAGMAYPTTLELITALWSGPGCTRSIALWSGTGGAIASLGPLLSGFLLGFLTMLLLWGEGSPYWEPGDHPCV